MPNNWNREVQELRFRDLTTKPRIVWADTTIGVHTIDGNTVAVIVGDPNPWGIEAGRQVGVLVIIAGDIVYIPTTSHPITIHNSIRLALMYGFSKLNLAGIPHIARGESGGKLYPTEIVMYHYQRHGVQNG